LKCTRLMSTDWIPSKPLNLVPNTCKDRTLEKTRHWFFHATLADTLQRSLINDPSPK
jgi:hypothetical protein